MRADRQGKARIKRDEWLEDQCRAIQDAGRLLAEAVGEVNERTQHARTGGLGRRKRLTEAQVQQVQAACETLHGAQAAVQNTLFDCEHELRELRERDVSPAELLVDGERLIVHYRFLRRRARVLDGLLAFLPAVNIHAVTCRTHLERLLDGEELPDLLTVPDCGFALIALEQLADEDG